MDCSALIAYKDCGELGCSLPKYGEHAKRLKAQQSKRRIFVDFI
jgi:hypothetical protein